MNARRRQSDEAGKGPRFLERVEITSIAAGGEGVGRLADGRVVFVHRTAPGETAEILLTSERPRWARGRLRRLLETSSERRDAPCPHYSDCGGCTLEHLRYPAQLRAKARIVSDALGRIGGIDIDEPQVTTSPREFHYRNRVSFTLRRDRAGVVAGFHSIYEPTRIVPIDGRCLLPEEPIGLVWDALRASWGDNASRLPSGETLRLTLRATVHGEVGLSIDGGHGRGRPEELLTAVPKLRSIWWRANGANAAKHLGGSPTLTETWAGSSFEVGGETFLQVNRETAALLEAHVARMAGDVQDRTVVDTYSGIGVHGRRFADAGAHVTGIELDPGAVRIARRSGGGNFHVGRVEDLLPAALPADLLILNPPRSGLGSDVVELILREPPPRAIYVSCDPATLARDLKRLSVAYTLTSVRCFDLFPQTAHVETVVVLETP